MEKSKLVGQYEVKLRKNLTEDKENLSLIVTINEKTQELLREFAVLNEPVIEAECRNIPYKRYKIRNSIARNCEYDEHFLLFNEELLNNKKVKIVAPADSIMSILERERYFRQLMEKAIVLLQDTVLSIEVTVK